MTSSGKRFHYQHISRLKTTLSSVDTNPFPAEAPECFHSGFQISPSVLRDMLKAHEIGSDAFRVFASNRLLQQTQSFFDPIQRIILNTGITKKKPSMKAVSVQKEG